MARRVTVVLLFSLLILVASRAGHRNAYPLPEDRGTAGILGALQRLPVFVRVLYTTAHPDDESAATLTWLARRAHARTALLSLTRGDGGQNLLGDEKYEAMGLLRTGELLEACKIYGVETYFTTVFEFGFSKSAEETLSKWGRKQTLEEVVRFIRMWRPTIVISKWQGNSKDGHGHHQTAGILTHEAFRAAGDPGIFPEHLTQGLRPWQAKKLYRNNLRADSEQGEADWTVRLNVGRYDPILGRSFREIGSEGYAKHRSQSSGASYAPPGPSFDDYKLVDSTVGSKSREETFFDSIDTSLLAIGALAAPDDASALFLQKDLAAAQSAAEEALGAFQPRYPEAAASASVKGLAILTESIRKVESLPLAQPVKEIVQDALLEKRSDFQEAVNATLGIYLTARTEDPTAVPGEKIPVTVTFFNRGRETVDLRRVTLWTPEGWVSSLPAGAPFGEIRPGAQVSFKHTVEIPADARATEPFWYREHKWDVRYKTRATKNVFAAFDEPEIDAQAAYRYRNTEVSIRSAATAQASDPIRGVDFRDFQVVPDLSVTVKPEFVVAPISSGDQTREFQVSILCNGRSGASGSLRIQAPAGWTVQPAQEQFALSRKGESYVARFVLHIPPGTRAGSYPIEAAASTGTKEFRRGYRIVSYPENWTRHLYSPSSAEVKTFDVRVAPDLTVGYVAGAGDEVPGYLEQLGAKIQTLTGADLAFGDLRRFSAIVTGVRAYNVNEDLKANNKRLLQYAEQGGILIVQYNTPVGGRDTPFPYGPYPMTMSGSDRITVEDSAVELPDPLNPVFLRPNKITRTDFEGWVQERGLYFMSRWDSRYTPLLSGNDPGEEPKNGGMLFARYGRGFYIYTAYAWFRQLPAGVPGAFRIFANMLSLGK